MTKEALDIAKNIILAPAELTDSKLECLIGNIVGNQVDTADLYFQAARSESWVLENGIIKQGTFSIENGVGARAIAGEKTGFAYTDDVSMLAIEDAISAAKSITVHNETKAINLKENIPADKSLYMLDNPIITIGDTDKVNLLKELDRYARAKDTRVKEVIVSMAGSHEVVLVVDSEGRYTADTRPLVRLNVSVIVEENGRREQARSGGGGRHSLTEFLKDNMKLSYSYVDDAINEAITNLGAIPAPAGLMPVVLGPGWPGVLLHEAVGHGLEGDFNRKGSSAFSGRVGERVASSLCTVVDDGTLEGRRGSLNIDDEGTKTQCTTLIENGILKGYMQDRLNAKLMGVEPTGNGRRESYMHLPMPRMTNTYMLPGTSEPEEIISSVKKGIYAVNFGGGQVDITSGKFVFNACEAYLIEDGKVTTPVKGATLIGNGPEAMTKVSMVGNDLKLDKGVGVCGKDGQSVPVGVGQPTLLIDEMTVGGTET